jgi:formiminotetrahydrofolate cyclodeaminase
MSQDLMELPLRELLKKFAAGKHKPGSGSAAALLSLVSASLSQTVIALTKDRSGYEASRQDLFEIGHEIEMEIQPALELAFIDDSIQFDKVINTRNLRNDSDNHDQWWRRSHQALLDTDAASRIALQIARHSLRLAELSIRVFDIGFKSARGDSEVAIEAAMSGTTGALAIVYLNLKDFRGEPYARKTLHEANDLLERIDALQGDLQQRLDSLKARANRVNRAFSLNAPKLLLNGKKKSRYSRDEISEITRNLHSEIWLNRDQIWPNAEIAHPIDILDPETAFKVHGYSFEEATSLGTHLIDGFTVEVAGYVNNKSKEARISKKFDVPVRRFTSAHELGHAILHGDAILYRDRALDGGLPGPERNDTEKEADQFAACFLMPEVQVRDLFSAIFGKEVFELNRNSAFALGFSSFSSMKEAIRSLRDLTLKLAQQDVVSGQATRSLCEVFRVSPLAMAIRLEDLSLVTSPFR